MKGKRPTPPECPICTSREVVPPGFRTATTIVIKNVPGAGKLHTPKPKPKVIRYRCKQCGHKFTMP